MKNAKKHVSSLFLLLTVALLNNSVNAAEPAWVKVASQYQFFNLTTPTVTRFGTGTKWIEKTLVGKVYCSVGSFGSDPAYGLSKQCETQTTVPPVVETNNWVKVANEYQFFTLSSSETVRFGNGTQWIEKTLVGKVYCSVGSFGSDPAHGLSKQCQVLKKGTTPPPVDPQLPPASGAKYIPLTLAATPVSLATPIKTGIPFPMGALTDVNNMRIEKADGSKEIPSQINVLSQWPDGSIKAALVNMVVDMGSAQSYRIAYGGNIKKSELAKNISVTGNTSTELNIDTGVAKFTINNKGILSKAWKDTNGNGAFEETEQIINSGEMFLINTQDTQFTSTASTDTEVTVEENGALRTVIKSKGSLTSSSGVKIAKYLIRYYASQGSDKLDIEASIIDDKMEANVETTPATFSLAAKGLGLRWTYLNAGATTYRFGGEAGTAYEGKVSGEHYLLQNGSFTFRNGEDLGHTFSYSGVRTGEKAPGWVNLDSGNKHVTLMIKDFWQQYPSELNVNNNVLTASLFPARMGSSETTTPVQSGSDYKRANNFYFTRPGGAKTYQLRFALSNDNITTANLHALNDTYQRHKLDLMAPTSWYTSSGVFGDLNQGNPSVTKGYDAYLMKDIFEKSIEVGQGGNATMFGWRDYGDRLRAGWDLVQNGVEIPSFYNDTHVGANNFFTQFLRSGDQRWFSIADIATKHFIDIDVSHSQRAGYWSTGGLPQPAGEIHAIKHDNIDHQVRNVHWGHAHVSGMTDLYLLTGDKRSLDVLKEVAGWWKFVTPYFFKRPFAANDRYREAERDYGWPLYVMNEYVRATGDATYHKEVAGHLAAYMLEWFKTPLNHVGYSKATNTISNNVLGVNDFSKGTGYWTMTKMDNNQGYNATGTNPWMAGAMIGNLIKFYEADKQFAKVGKASGINLDEYSNMLLQGINYVVKYGYDTPRKYFVYSEVTRGYSGGDTHIIYPLIYLDRLYKEQLAAGKILNPAWYDTQSSWLSIATDRYDELQNMPVGANTQSYGFYGYEMVYPADYFTLMQKTLGR